MALDLSQFSATGTIHMQMRITAGNYERGNGQENLWAGTDWTADGTAGQVGTIEEGSAVITADVTLARFARWDSGDRLILNAVGNISNLFDQSADVYRLTFVRETSTGHELITVGPPSGESADRTFADWRVSDGTLSSSEWNQLNAISNNDEFILAIHEGTASYGPTVEELAMEARAGAPTAAFALRAIPPVAALSVAARAGDPTATFALRAIASPPVELAMEARAGNLTAAFDLRAIAQDVQRLAVAARAGNPTAAFDLRAIAQDVQRLSVTARAGNPTAAFALRAIAQDVQRLAMAARAGNPTAAFALTAIGAPTGLSVAARAGAPTATFGNLRAVERRIRFSDASNVGTNLAHHPAGMYTSMNVFWLGEIEIHEVAAGVVEVAIERGGSTVNAAEFVETWGSDWALYLIDETTREYAALRARLIHRADQERIAWRSPTWQVVATNVSDVADWILDLTGTLIVAINPDDTYRPYP